MRLGLLVVACLGTSLGCTELLTSLGDGASTAASGTEKVCTVRNAKGLCTEWGERETTEARWLRETTDERDREEAYRKGEPFFPQSVPGESTEKHLGRMDEERRRQEAYRKGLQRMTDER
ncbi:MAG TPA: hypothetical protein VGL81_26720 [Polyangiaceae bacterium]|jgi:uncharacterized NAD(P)/FAD-binding protein YdhS